MLKKIIIYVFIICIGLVLYVIFTNKPNENTMPKTKTESAKLPFSLVNKNKKYTATLNTSEGDVKIDLYVDKTPITVSNFISLAKKGFYDKTIFHRVISGFMIQGGDPKGDGTGGPGYRFDDEIFVGEYTRGTIAMANAGPNTNGSQFFIMHQDYPLPKNYIIFGKVVKGIEVVDKIASVETKVNPGSGEKSTPINPVTIKSVTVKEN